MDCGHAAVMLPCGHAVVITAWTAAVSYDSCHAAHGDGGMGSWGDEFIRRTVASDEGSGPEEEGQEAQGQAIEGSCRPSAGPGAG